MAREDFLKNNTELAKLLLEIDDEQLILIADGTYLYCQKVLIIQFKEQRTVAKKSDI